MSDSEPGLRLIKATAEEKSGSEADVPTAFPIGLNDVGNGKRFARDWSDVARYCFEKESWFVYDDGRWRADISGEVFRMAKQTAAGIKDEVAINGDTAALYRHCDQSLSGRAIREMLTMARSEEGIPCSLADFDKDLMLLNVMNGTIDLRTVTFREHRREDMLAHQAPVVYDECAYPCDWMAFMKRIMASDKSMIGFLQRFAGLCLSGDVSDAAFFFFVGTGANGKGTFLSTLQALIGPDLSHSLPVDYFISSRNQVGRIQLDVHAARGKRMTVVSECQRGAHFDAAKLKMWSGEDERSGKGMRENLSRYNPTDKLVFQTNHIPGFDDPSGGFRRRLKLTPFKVEIPENEFDRQLKEKLRQPWQLSGILNWCLRGFADWQQRRLDTPQAVKDATSELLTLQDQLLNFIKDTCIGVGEKFSEDRRVAVAEVSRKDLFDAYKRWCEENGEGKGMSARKLVPAMREQGFLERRPHGVDHWIGIGLASSLTSLPNAPTESKIKEASDAAANDPLFQV